MTTAPVSDYPNLPGGSVLDEPVWQLFIERPDDVTDDALALMHVLLAKEEERVVNALLRVRAEGSRRLQAREAETIASDRSRISYKVTNKYTPDYARLVDVLPAPVAAEHIAFVDEWDETVHHEAKYELRHRNLTPLVNAINKLPEDQRGPALEALHNNPVKSVVMEVFDD